MPNNLTNANSDFHNIVDSDFNKHWSFSIFFRNLAILEQINKLPRGARVVEVGAANSDLGLYISGNINREDIDYVRVDVNPEYDTVAIIADISKAIPLAGTIDLIIAAEVIEHMETKVAARDAIQNMYHALKDNGKLVLTTPTPSALDDLVWPDSHEWEFTFQEIYSLVNEYFEIQKALPWSMKEREYNKALESDDSLRKIHAIMRGAYSESLIRAIISLLCNNDDARQTMLIAQKRRVKNVRPASSW